MVVLSFILKRDATLLDLEAKTGFTLGGRNFLAVRFSFCTNFTPLSP